MKKKLIVCGCRRQWVKKMLRVTKVGFFLLVLGFMSIHVTVFSQEKVCLDIKNETLLHVLDALQEQSEYTFLFSSEDVKNVTNLSIKARDENVFDVLKRCLSGTGLNYEVNGKLVILRLVPKENDTPKKPLRLKGFVYDSQKYPMPGVTVKIAGVAMGTATDEKGWFTLELPMQKGRLEFSFVGFKKKIIEFSEIVVNDTLRITLEEEIQTLDETVVVAYGTTTRRKSTGAISVVKAEEMKGIPSVSIETLLQGRVAGMDVTTMSGSPGGGGTAVTIRGYNSLDVEQGRRFSNPLWVVDGVPLNSFTSPVTGTNLLSDLNPDMIESVQVLKDASSAAIYGSRAANGVIIVTTKKGKKNQSTVFSVNVSQTWSILPELPTVTTGRAERNLRLLAERDNFRAYIDPKTKRFKYPVSLREQYDNTNSVLDGNFITVPMNADNGSVFQDSLNPFYNNSTNFFPMYYVKGKVTNANIQTFGGSERITYGIGVGYYKEDGIFRGTGFNRVDINSSMGVNPVPRLNVDLRFNASLSNRKRGTQSKNMGTAPSIETVPGDPYKLSSLKPGKGSVVWDAVLDKYRGTKEKNRSIRLRTNFRIGYELIDGLTLSSSLAADYSIERRNYFQPSYMSTYGYSKSLGETGINLMVLNENLLSYTRRIQEFHEINFVMGFSYQYDQEEYNGGSAENSPSDKIHYAPSGMPIIGKQGPDPIAFQRYRSDMQEKGLLSYFARLEYSYLNKYMLSASIRRDGSSTFGEDKRWGTFPSFAVGWTFTEEPFMKSLSWFSFGKIRASWGCSGMHFTSNYLALGVLKVGASAYLGNPTINPVWRDGLYNKNLSWEETSQYDFGLDMDFFDYRLTFTVDYYYRYTDHLLARIPLPGSHNGYIRQWRNTAAISNEGLEVAVKYEILRKPELFWKISLNAARNWNRFVKSYNGKDFDSRIIGKPLNGIYAQKTDGFIQSQDEMKLYFTQTGVGYYLAPENDKNYFYKPGDYKFVDVNGDSKIDNDDKMYVGSSLPKVSGGIVNELRWRNFDVNLLLSYQLGRCMVNSTIKKCLSSDLINEALVLDLSKLSFWENPGDKPDFPEIPI